MLGEEVGRQDVRGELWGVERLDLDCRIGSQLDVNHPLVDYIDSPSAKVTLSSFTELYVLNDETEW